MVASCASCAFTVEGAVSLTELRPDILPAAANDDQGVADAA